MQDDPCRREFVTLLEQSESNDSRVRSGSGLQLFLEQTQTLNLRELCELLQTCVLKKPSTSPATRQYLMSAYSCIVRLKLHQEFEEQVASFNYLWDDLMACQFNSLWKEGTSPDEFLEKYREHLTIVMNLEDVDYILNSGEDWLALIAPLNRVM